MAKKLFPLERILGDTDKIMRTVKKLPRRSGRETVAALLLAAATVAVKAGYDKSEFQRGVKLAWRVAARMIAANIAKLAELFGAKTNVGTTREIREFGGELVTARGKVDVLEGQWQPKAITILKFESKQALMKWYQSYEYAPLKQMRLESNIGDFIVVDEV